MKLATILLLMSWIAPLTAQETITPKVILFDGAPEYTTAELLEMTELVPGVPLHPGDIYRGVEMIPVKYFFTKEADDPKYTFDGNTLHIRLKPATMKPVSYKNFVLETPEELNHELRLKFPHYAGEVKPNGQYDERRLEDALAEIETKKLGTPVSVSTNEGNKTVECSLYTPKVVVGTVKVIVDPSPDTPPSTLPNEIQKHLSAPERLIDSAYDGVYSAKDLRKAIRYQLQKSGYASVKVGAVMRGEPIVTASKITVPLSVHVQPGSVYHVATVSFEGSAPGVSTAEVESKLAFKLGDIAPTADMEPITSVIQSAFVNHGYLDARTKVIQTKDVAAHTVAYTFHTTPGEIFKIRTFDDSEFPKAGRKALEGAWKAPAGSAYTWPAVYALAAAGNHGCGAHAFKVTLHLDDDGAALVDVRPDCEESSAPRQKHLPGGPATFHVVILSPMEDGVWTNGDPNDPDPDGT